MTDLIERWREARESYVALNMKCVGTEMAHEIKRLRAALEAIMNHPEMNNYESPSYYHGRDELQEIAREALKDEQSLVATIAGMY